MEKIFHSFEELQKNYQDLFATLGTHKHQGLMRAIWEARNPEILSLEKENQELKRKYKQDQELLETKYKTEIHELQNQLLDMGKNSEQKFNKIKLDTLETQIKYQKLKAIMETKQIEEEKIKLCYEDLKGKHSKLLWHDQEVTRKLEETKKDFEILEKKYQELSKKYQEISTQNKKQSAILEETYKKYQAGLNYLKSENDKLFMAQKRISSGMEKITETAV